MHFRDLPSISSLLDAPALAAHPPALAARAAREVVDEIRQRLRDGEAVGDDFDFIAAATARAAALRRPRLRRVINATGVVLHTNMGRAPLPPAALDAVCDVARGYSCLELDLETGRRGKRMAGVERLLCELTGAEAAVAVNNNAAAVLLALTALARGREVIVSRGELVEIGGSFRVPEIISDGGARLVEVGATNRTRVSDFARACTEQTAMMLRVHTSNFRIIGFTEKPDRAALVQLAEERGVLVVEDLGSGLLGDAPAMERDTSALTAEESVRRAVAAGVHAVCFSGDKLLGGPQAGVVVGRRDVIHKLRRHPLYRALRLDKLVMAALEATLLLYRAGLEDREIPARQMLARTTGELRAAAAALAARLPHAAVEPGVSYSGGGALPEEELPTSVVSLAVDAPDQLAARLRAGDPPIMARVQGGRLRLDPRTLLPGEADEIVARLRPLLL